MKILPPLNPELKEKYKKHLLDDKVNLKDLLPHELKDFFLDIGEKPYRADQLVRWIYVRLEHDFNHMTDLSKALREKLSHIAVVPELKLIEKQVSIQKDTAKYLFELPDGGEVESVRMQYLDNLGPGRVAVCISSQVGCAMGCTFCASGLFGLKKNLKTWEIVDQVIQIQKDIAHRGERVANVVYMGLGEPLHNYDNVIRSLRLINLQEGIGIGQRHITVSTSGLVPKIEQLSEEGISLRLAISFHATTDTLRTQLMPVNKKWNIQKLLDACRKYQSVTKRRITFEYLLIDDVNDTPEDAHRLVELLDGIHALVNLIPWNPVEGIDFRQSKPKAIRQFQNIIYQSGIKCTVRQEKGADIDAACGQLRLKHIDKTRE